MAALTVPATRTLQDPKIVLTIDPVTLTMQTEVTETCHNCAGYGDHCGQCDRGTVTHVIETKTPLPAQLATQIGPKAAQDVIDLLATLCKPG